MKSISVHVSETDYLELKSLASAGARPVAELIREAMAQYLHDHRQSGPSISELLPHPSGSLRSGWTRDELFDEMTAR